jgi:hypothetical protein
MECRSKVVGGGAGKSVTPYSESRWGNSPDATLPRNNGAGVEAPLPVPQTDTGGLG